LCRGRAGLKKNPDQEKKSGSNKKIRIKKKYCLNTIATSRREGKEKERKGKEGKGRKGRKEGRKEGGKGRRSCTFVKIYRPSPGRWGNMMVGFPDWFHHLLLEKTDQRC
jgi:hypothetical protein